MSWRQSLWLGLGLLCVLALLYFVQSPFRDITSPPPEQARASTAMDPGLSYISIPITLPLSTIEAYANQEIPEILVHKKEDRRFKVRFLGIPTTVEGEVETVVKRRGPIKVSTQDDWLQLSIPLWFKAHMEGEGTFDPDAKTRGAVTITARFRLSVDEQWQPHMDADARYHWDKKPYLRMGPVRVRVSTLVGQNLESKLDEAVLKLKNKVSNDLHLRDRAQARWHELHQVRALSDEFSAWLMIDPQAAYFPPVQYSEEALKIEFGLATYLQTSVGEVPAPPEPESLPPLIKGYPPQNGFSIQLPVHLNYAGISRELNAQHAGKTITLEQGRITPKEFRLYASEHSLVVAARISAKAPNRLFNTHGWIYLKGEPRYDAEKRILYVDQLDFTREVDNLLVSGATWVLQDALRDKIGRALQFDLNERIESLRQSANERINRPLGEGFSLYGELDHLNLAYLVPQRQDLLIVLNAHGQLAIGATLEHLEIVNKAPAP